MLHDIRRAIRTLGKHPGFATASLLTLALGAALLLVALFACLIPARRAAGVDPLVALRCD